MLALSGVIRDYAWGSVTSIPEFLGDEPAKDPTAELWFGAHSSGPSPIPELDMHLGGFVDGDPAAVLGEGALEHFGKELPFLLKLLAPAAPLSLQVHPSLDQARDGFARAAAGGADAPVDYVDENHKPELLYPLTEFEVLSGIREAAEILEALEGLSHPMLDRVRTLLTDSESASAVADAFAHVLTSTSAEDADAVAEQCALRAEAGTSPAPHSDDIVARLNEAHPGDRGIVASLFLTPRILQPGEVMFVPAGTVHAYFSGLGVELMANSDNVLRAGLTSKNVDVPELLKVVDPDARAVFPTAENVAPGITRYPTPVKDFELTAITTLDEPVTAEARGPRIVLALEDGAHLRVPGPVQHGTNEMVLNRGQAAFVADYEGPVDVRRGSVLQAGIPAAVHARSSELAS